MFKLHYELAIPFRVRLRPPDQTFSFGAESCVADQSKRLLPVQCRCPDPKAGFSCWWMVAVAFHQEISCRRLLTVFFVFPL